MPKGAPETGMADSLCQQMLIARGDDWPPAGAPASRFFRFPLGSNQPEKPPMPATTSLLALAGVVGFALLSLLFGIFT